MTDQINEDQSDRFRVLIGGVSFAAEIIPTTATPPGEVVARLLENVGNPDTFTGDEATSYFASGTMVRVRDKGDGYHRLLTEAEARA